MAPLSILILYSTGCEDERRETDEQGSLRRAVNGRIGSIEGMAASGPNSDARCLSRTATD